MHLKSLYVIIIYLDIYFHDCDILKILNFIAIFFPEYLINYMFFINILDDLWFK